MKIFEVFEKLFNQTIPVEESPVKLINFRDYEIVAKTIVCNHQKPDGNFRITILGFEYEFKESIWCPVCMKKYLDEFSALCDTCKRPIFPGSGVAIAPKDSKFPFTHMYNNCAYGSYLYCGVWGEGKWITLKELGH